MKRHVERYVFQDCRAEWKDERELRPIKDVFQRVLPGELMPAGECPTCGAVCHAEPTAAPIGSEVWVLTYEHRHADDRWAFPSEDACRLKAVALVMEWISEVEDARVREEIQAQHKSRNWDALLGAWREYQDTRLNNAEYLNWEGLSVEPAPSGDPDTWRDR